MVKHDKSILEREGEVHFGYGNTLYIWSSLLFLVFSNWYFSLTPTRWGCG